ncbi:3977_t:CDS:1, partial [Acaulospora colombiana]
MAYANGNGHTSNPYQRSPSPPATAYFSGFQTESEALRPDLQREPIAHTDAQAHFAYSTTLRRHQVDSSGHAVTPIRPEFFTASVTTLWGRIQRAWDIWRRDGKDALIESGWGGQIPTEEPEPPKEG